MTADLTRETPVFGPEHLDALIAWTAASDDRRYGLSGDARALAYGLADELLMQTFGILALRAAWITPRPAPNQVHILVPGKYLKSGISHTFVVTDPPLVTALRSAWVSTDADERIFESEARFAGYTGPLTPTELRAMLSEDLEAAGLPPVGDPPNGTGLVGLDAVRRASMHRRVAS